MLVFQDKLESLNFSVFNGGCGFFTFSGAVLIINYADTVFGT